MVPGEGLEPSRCRHRRILSPLRLPFRHPGAGIPSDGGAAASGHPVIIAEIPRRALRASRSDVQQRERRQRRAGRPRSVGRDLQPAAAGQQRDRRERDGDLDQGLLVQYLV